MSHTLAIPHHRAADFGRRHRMLVGVVLGLVVGAFGLAAADAAAPLVQAALAGGGAAAVVSGPEFPARELPREWRWERPAVNFDSMYRQKGAPRIDWIRESGTR